MPTAAKQATIAEIAQRFRDSDAVVLTEYRGLSVKQLSALRSSLRPHATYSVVKNTLTDLAAEHAGVTAFQGQLSGPSAVVFITGDAVQAAKSLRDFARANPLLVIKSGLLEGRELSAADITALADLESREVVLARMAGALSASLSRAVALFAAPLGQAARLVDAWRAEVSERTAPAPAGAAPADAAGAAPADAAGAAAPEAELPST